MIIGMGSINLLTVYKATSPFPNTLLLLVSFGGDSPGKEGVSYIYELAKI